MVSSAIFWFALCAIAPLCANADETSAGNDTVAQDRRPVRLIFLKPAGDCPADKLDALRESWRLTIDKYRDTGVDLIVKTQADLNDWLESDGKAYGRALTSYQWIAYTQALDADMMGGIGHWSPPESLAQYYKDAKPTFYGWIVSLPVCGMTESIAPVGRTDARATRTS